MKNKKTIKIKSEKEFQNLLAQGYKVVNNYNRFSMSKDKENGELKFDYNYGYIFLEKNNEQLIVDCSDLGALFASQYSQVADIDGTFFDKVPNQTEKADVEMYTYDHFDHRRKPCIHVEQIDSSNTEKIIQYLRAYVESEIKLYSTNNLGKNLFNIFTDVIMITENNSNIECEIYAKDQLTIQKINELREDAKHLQNCFVFSFLYIYSKSKKSEYHPDIFIGCILYDLKNQKTISFNLTSTYEDGESSRLESANLFIHSCKKIFEKSLSQNNFLSMMYVSILHTTYTPLPWIFFATLYPFENIAKNLNNSKFFLNIPEFFVFGISKDLNLEDSFYYKNITKNTSGSAVIRFDFLNTKKIDYNLRFDVSKGEQFLHIDFGYYSENKMNKLLSHFPIDMDLVKNFSTRLFVSIISAGFYDPEFADIVKNKLKNIAEIVKKYNELSEPLKIIHNANSTAKWLEDNNLFDEFVKIYNNQKNIDYKKFYEISNQYGGLFHKDKKGVIGFTHSGLMVLVRKFKGSEPKLYFIKNYLAKHNSSLIHE